MTIIERWHGGDKRNRNFQKYTAGRSLMKNLEVHVLASQGADFESIGNAPLNFSCWDLIVWHGVNHAPSNKPEAGRCCFLLLSERCDQYNNTKISKADITFLKKKKKKGKASLTFVCTCGSNMRQNIQIESRKIERGIAIISLVLITTTCLMYRNRFPSYLVMGNKLGSATDIYRLLVPSRPSTPIFT